MGEGTLSCKGGGGVNGRRVLSAVSEGVGLMGEG